MYDRKDYYYDPVNHYYTYDPDGYHARQSYGGQQADMFSGNDGEFGNHTGGPDRKAKKEKKSVTLTRSKLIALMLVMVMLAGLAGFGGAKLAGAGNFTVSQNDQTVTNTGYDLKESTGSKLSIQQIADKCQDSVVSIRTESVSQGSWIREYVTEGAGSGVIFKSNGYILTNNHVIEGANKVTVTVDTKNGKAKDYEAKIVGTDASNDVAVLKINAKNLSAATLGKSSSTSVGDMAVVVGNPLGELGDSVSAGIISSTSRKVTIENQQMNLIQTDASINPGNSGGGLFNGSGQLVGLVVAKSSGTGIEGLGFAIPIDTVLKSAQNIINGKVNDNAGAGNDQQQDQGNSSNNGNDNWGGGSQDGGQDDFWNDNGGSEDSGSLFDFFF